MATENINAGLLKVREDLLLQIEELKQDIQAIERLLQRHKPLNGNGTHATAQRQSQPTSSSSKSKYDVDVYSPDLTWNQKIIYVVKEIGGGDVEDVARRLRQLDKDLNEDIAKRNATLYLSALYKKGELRAVRSGKRYRYSV